MRGRIVGVLEGRAGIGPPLTCRARASICGAEDHVTDLTLSRNDRTSERCNERASTIAGFGYIKCGCMYLDANLVI